jgi:hypothetical protein
MTAQASDLAPASTMARPTVNLNVAVAVLTLLPILMLAVLSWGYVAAGHRAPPVESNNIAAVGRMAATFAHPSTHADSWSPMQHASETLAGPDRQRLYERLFFRDQVRFQYPPSSLLWTEGLARFGVSGAKALNLLNSLAVTLNAALIAALAWSLFRRNNGPPAGISGPGVAAVAFVASLLFYPVVRAHLLGQIQLWIDVLFTAAVLAWSLERRAVAGVLIGLACTIKPQLALLLAWALLWREWRFLIGGALVLASLELLSLARYGLHNQLAYLQVLSFLSRHGESFFANNSVNGILNWYLSGQDSLHWYDQAFTPFVPLVYAGAVAASVLFYGLILLQPLVNRSRRPRTADLGAAAICTVVGAPVAWEHHFGLLPPLFLLALARLVAANSGRTRTLLAAATLTAWILTADFLPFASAFAGSPLVVLQAYCFFGALLLLWVLLWRSEGGAVPARVSP